MPPSFSIYFPAPSNFIPLPPSNFSDIEPMFHAHRYFPVLVLFFFLSAGCAPKSAPDEETPAEEKVIAQNTMELLHLIKENVTSYGFDEYTFIQETIRFNKDGSVRDTTTWYEAMRFPDHFRIDFGELEEGNAVIYRNDSSYLFREGELARLRAEENELMLLEGGMYIHPVDTIAARMKRQGYDLSQFHQAQFRDEPVYVIGAAASDSSSKQIWIHQDKLTTMRRIDPNEDRIVEAVFDDFILKDGGWIETWVEFYLNGQLLQTERYKDINTQPKLQDLLFDPNRFGEWNWH